MSEISELSPISPEVPAQAGAFFLEDEALPEAFPQIARFIEIEQGRDPYGLLKAYDERNSQLVAEYGVASRESIRTHENSVTRHMSEFVHSVAMQLHMDGRTDAIRETAHDIIQSYPLNVHADLLAIDVEFHVLKAREIDVLSNELIRELREIILPDNHQARYEILKLISGDVVRGELKPRTALLRMMRNASQDGELTFDKELAADLENGVFDAYIANDALAYKEAHPETNGNHAAISEVEHNYRQAFGDVFSPEELRMRAVTTTHTWPESAATALMRLRTDLADKLAYNANVAVIDQDFTLATPTKPLTTAAHEFARALIKADQKRMRSAIQRNTGVRRTRSKRNGTSLVIKSQFLPPVREAETTPEIEAMPEPRPLLYVTTEGVEYPKDSPEYARFIDEFLDKFDHQRELTHVLDKALEGLEYLDLSKRVPWVFPLKSGYAGSGYDKRSIWEAKPSRMPGLSPKGERGRLLRVLFSLGDDEAIHIHALSARKDVPTIRSNGVGGKKAR